MSDTVHGHEVMQMLAESGQSYPKALLLEKIAEKFGADVRFHTCFADALTAEQLVDFLTQKGKFVESEQGLSMPAGMMC